MKRCKQVIVISISKPKMRESENCCLVKSCDFFWVHHFIVLFMIFNAFVVNQLSQNSVLVHAIQLLYCQAGIDNIKGTSTSSVLCYAR